MVKVFVIMVCYCNCWIMTSDQDPGQSGVAEPTTAGVGDQREVWALVPGLYDGHLSVFFSRPVVGALKQRRFSFLHHVQFLADLTCAKFGADATLFRGSKWGRKSPFSSWGGALWIRFVQFWNKINLWAGLTWGQNLVSWRGSKLVSCTVRH